MHAVGLRLGDVLSRSSPRRNRATSLPGMSHTDTRQPNGTRILLIYSRETVGSTMRSSARCLTQQPELCSLGRPSQRIGQICRLNVPRFVTVAWHYGAVRCVSESQTLALCRMHTGRPEDPMAI